MLRLAVRSTIGLRLQSSPLRSRSLATRAFGTLRVTASVARSPQRRLLSVSAVRAADQPPTSSASEFLRDEAAVPIETVPFVDESTVRNMIINSRTGIEATGENIGDLAALGFCNYTPVGLVQTLLETLHVGLGLSWATTIVSFTITFRLMILPLILDATRAQAALGDVKPLIENHTQLASQFEKEGNFAAATNERRLMQGVLKKSRVGFRHLFGGIVVQMPVVLSMFLALRQLAELPVPSLTHGGYAPYADLTVVDSTYVLPAIAASLIFTSGMVSALSVPKYNHRKLMRVVFGVISIISIPIMVRLPVILFYYWIPTNLSVLLQATILRSPTLRSRIGLKPLPKIETYNPNDTTSNPLSEVWLRGREMFREQEKQYRKDTQVRTQAELGMYARRAKQLDKKVERTPPNRIQRRKRNE